MDIHLNYYYIGILIVFGTHIVMLRSPKPEARAHALTNLFAACCIAYYFMNKEGFIRF
jgi:hypothetical protein